MTIVTMTSAFSPLMDRAIREVRAHREHREKADVDNQRRSVCCPDCGASLRVVGGEATEQLTLEFVRHAG